METKHCPKCNETKNIDCFELRADTGKYRCDCKYCRKKYVNEYRRTNEKYKEKERQHKKKRRDTELAVVIKDRYRARITKVLKIQETARCDTFWNLLGCDIPTFVDYIKSMFTENLNFDLRNFELDHKIPISHFNLKDPEQQRKCFHYTNIQLLTTEENTKKGNQILSEFQHLI